jgi:hypothetical protein
MARDNISHKLKTKCATNQVVNTRNKCIAWKVDTSISEHTACVAHSLKRGAVLLQISQRSQCHSLLHHETSILNIFKVLNLCVTCTIGTGLLHFPTFRKATGNGAPINDIKAHRWRQSTTPLNPDMNTTWRWMDAHMPWQLYSQYPLNKRLSGTHFLHNTNTLPLPGFEPHIFQPTA